MGHIQLHCAVVLHVHGDHHISTRLVTDRQGHGLEAGDRHCAARQSDCACSHAAQRTRGRQVRHSVSRLYSRTVRRARRKSARHSSRHCCVRLVRHSIVDRRNRHPFHALGNLAGGCRERWRGMGLLPRLLAIEYDRGVARRRVHSPSAGFWRALYVCHGRGAANLGTHQGRQFRLNAFNAEPVPLDRRVSRGLLSVSHSDGGLLGHARAEHPGLHTLLQIADVAGLGSGVWIARRHDALYLCQFC
jgi:hypothetical protein